MRRAMVPGNRLGITELLFSMLMRLRALEYNFRFGLIITLLILTKAHKAHKERTKQLFQGLLILRSSW